MGLISGKSVFTFILALPNADARHTFQYEAANLYALCLNQSHLDL